MKDHYIKIQPIHYERLMSGEKTCEIRLNDRDYQSGDSVSFEVIEDGKGCVQYKFRIFTITHVLTFPEGLKEGYVALSLKSEEECVLPKSEPKPIN